MKSLPSKIREASNDSTRVNIIESNYNSVMKLVKEVDFSSDSFKTAFLMMQSLYKKGRYELIVVLFSGIDFKKILQFEESEKFAFLWIRSFYHKKKVKEIAKNYELFRSISLLDVEIIEILEYSKQEKNFPSLYLFIRGLEVVLVSVFTASISVGMHGIGFLLGASTIVLIIQWFRFFMYKNVKGVKGDFIHIAIQFGLIISLSGLIYSYGYINWLILFLYPLILISSSWVSEGGFD